MRVLILGGKFDDEGGCPSGFVNKFQEAFKTLNAETECFNGGHFRLLDDMLSNLYQEYVFSFDVIFWMVDVPNDKPKLLGKIKEMNPRAILVSSKNNLDNKYTRMHLIARALSSKSNLLIEFKRCGHHVSSTVIDPLNNCFIENEENINVIAKVIYDRLLELVSFTRIPSKNIGNAIIVPKEEEFFQVARQYADRFHELIHAANQDRFLGNLSFRCEKGFPSFRSGDLVFVSQRNIDKRNINENGFVAINAHSESCVEYYGDHKPSVDTPIQIRLYNYYPNVKYMLHAHVYIENAGYTQHLIPCGAVEEFDDIVGIFPDKQASNFCVNLKGHGCLVLAQDVEYMKTMSFLGR